MPRDIALYRNLGSEGHLRNCCNNSLRMMGMIAMNWYYDSGDKKGKKIRSKKQNQYLMSHNEEMGEIRWDYSKEILDLIGKQ